LQPEHRIVDKEGNRIDSVRRVGRARGDERGHRARFGDALFQNLPVLGFFVVQQGVDVDGFVELTAAAVDSDLAEEGFHAERTGFIGDNGNDKLPDFGIAQHLAQHADEGHGR
jgi:hypothetical protein